MGRLKAIHELRVQADEALDYLENEAVAAARSAGASWEVVGKALGLSTSAALRKYDPPDKRDKGIPLFDVPELSV